MLHLKGTPREMGLQHGTLLKADIVEEVRFLFDVKAKEFKPEVFGLKVPLDARRMILSISELQRKHTPSRYYEELRGIAEGAGVPYADLVAANFIPETVPLLGVRPGRLGHEGRHASITGESSTTAATGSSRTTPSWSWPSPMGRSRSST